jgi:hypothetical protein
MMFDMAKLKNLKKLDEGSPQAMKAFWAFDKAVFQDGEVSVLNKQLMAVAVALTTQCLVASKFIPKRREKLERPTRNSPKRPLWLPPCAQALRSRTPPICLADQTEDSQPRLASG